VSKPAPARAHRRPVDTFFSSLAEDQEENAVATAANVERLQNEPHETELFFRELLIGVTRFFRDPSGAADAGRLPTIPSEFGCRGCCATGDKVYSVAILLKEAVDKRDAGPKFQILADEHEDHVPMQPTQSQDSESQPEESVA
jgi:chemotaxis methyl-accepting protein methylase